MKIAVPYQGGAVFGHFGHTSQFKVYTTEDGTVTDIRMLAAAGSGHSALASLLQEAGIDVLICGGIGGCAKDALGEAGIRIYGGVSGDADRAVAAFLVGKLNFNPEANCDHHDHEHRDGHSCSGHCRE